jgi:hypothetical protein
MPRYFFNLIHRKLVKDPTGEVLRDDDAAVTAGELIAAKLAAFRPNAQNWTLMIVDRSGAEIARVTVPNSRSSALSRVRIN